MRTNIWQFAQSKRSGNFPSADLKKSGSLNFCGSFPSLRHMPSSRRMQWRARISGIAEAPPPDSGAREDILKPIAAYSFSASALAAFARASHSNGGFAKLILRGSGREYEVLDFSYSEIIFSSSPRTSSRRRALASEALICGRLRQPIRGAPHSNGVSPRRASDSESFSRAAPKFSAVSKPDFARRISNPSARRSRSAIENM